MKKQIVFLMIIVMICLPGCGLYTAPQHFTQAQKVEYTTLKTLQSAKVFREFALQSAGTAYKNGLMDDAVKNDIIKAGDRLQMAINSAADALVLYHQARGMGGTKALEEKLTGYQAIFNRFMEIVTPYITGKEVVDV